MAKYFVGDIVWVKINRCPWWPAEILDPKLCPLSEKVNQSSFIAYVKFFNEDEYQMVTTISNILPFKCPQHEAFIQKGKGVRRESLNAKFQPAVALAERKYDEQSQIALSEHKNEESQETLSRCSSSVTDYDPNLDEESSGSDSELPEGLPVPSSNVIINEKDAVWVKYRQFPYWPAVVERVTKDKKRLGIKFLGVKPSNRIHIHMGKRQILPFSHSKREEFEAMGKTLDDSLMTDFKNAVHEAEVYINKKALESLGGEKDDSDLEASFNMSVEANGEAAKPPDCDLPPVKRRRLSMSAANGKVNKAIEVQNRKERLKARNQSLVEYIMSDNMKKYLLQILKKERRSDLHQKYQTSQGERNRLRHAGFGPIENEEQQDEITFKLVEWMREATGATIVDISYILDVWVPEAVVYALMKVKCYGRTMAWRMFWKGYKMTKAECKEIHNHLIHFSTFSK